MKTPFKLLTLSFLLLGLTNCGTTLFTLSPDEESSLEMGRRVIEKKNNLVLSALSFEDRSEHEFALFLYVKNNAQEALLLDPSNIYVKAFDENKRKLNYPRIYAVDPEEQIYVIEKEIEKRDEEHDVATGLNIVFSLFDTFVDLSDDEDNNAEEVLENVVIFTGNQIGEEIDYENDIEFLNSQKSFWKNEVLRKTELSENEDIGGMIYLPIIEEAKFIKIFIPLGKTQHTFKFQQIEI